MLRIDLQGALEPSTRLRGIARLLGEIAEIEHCWNVVSVQLKGALEMSRCLVILLQHLRVQPCHVQVHFFGPFTYRSEFFSEKWYLASAVSERMTYVDGPLYVQNPRPKWLQERADRTLRFAENPNFADLRELQSWGVAWFVADKNWPTTSDWSTVGSVAMENESCVVVKLRAT